MKDFRKLTLTIRDGENVVQTFAMSENMLALIKMEAKTNDLNFSQVARRAIEQYFTDRYIKQN